MNKPRRYSSPPTDLPAVSGQDVSEMPIETDVLELAMPAAAESISLRSSTGMLQAPMLDAGDIGFVRRHLNCKLNAQQAAVLKSITLALHAKGEKLASGRRVESIATAAQWVFENIAKQ